MTGAPQLPGVGSGRAVVTPLRHSPEQRAAKSLKRSTRLNALASASSRSA
jgi:hypothetical protein